MWGHGWTNPDVRYLPAESFAAIQGMPAYLRSEPLSDEEMVKMYSRSEINLGFSSCGDTHMGSRIGLRRCGCGILRCRCRGILHGGKDGGGVGGVF